MIAANRMDEKLIRSLASSGREERVRDIRGLARRVYERLRERARTGKPAISINDTLSRILAHEPKYPSRPRVAEPQRSALVNPGVFTLQKNVADPLEITVGNLLGEEGHPSARDFLDTADRRQLRDLVRRLHQLFDLDDPDLDEQPPERPPASTPSYRFLVSEKEFRERDHDYPRTLHAWIVPELPDAAGSTGAEPDTSLTTTRVLHSIQEVWDARFQVLRVLGDSMAPDLLNGWKVLVDTRRVTPATGDLVAVYLHDEGGILGRWHRQGDLVTLRKTNASYEPIVLHTGAAWTLWGTVTQIVEAPVLFRPLQD